MTNQEFLEWKKIIKDQKGKVSLSKFLKYLTHIQTFTLYRKEQFNYLKRTLGQNAWKVNYVS